MEENLFHFLTLKAFIIFSLIIVIVLCFFGSIHASLLTWDKEARAWREECCVRAGRERE